METAYELARCPVCDGAGEEVADAAELRREAEWLWEFHLRRLRPGTPTRFLADRVFFSQPPPLRLERCAGCGTLFRNPRERGRELARAYGAESVDADVLRGLADSQGAACRTQARRLTRFAGGAGRGVEVGSYVGAFLAAARVAGWDFEGVDVNEAANRLARERGFRVRTGSLADLSDREARYDAVAIWNCFDQLPHPRAAAAAARRLLRPGGLLALRVPNGGFYAALRPALRGPLAPLARVLLAHNNLLAFPYRFGFTPASLARLLREEGLSVVGVVGDALVPTADAWTRPWAAREERALKALLRALAPASASPWFELYARAV
ncbi:MAG TPA: methyltransferase domain-containing protein [Longimicrobiaceae bacterium]|nr:methyltransferase domain-containing protein [Longimicrobiaceae bacterium]